MPEVSAIATDLPTLSRVAGTPVVEGTIESDGPLGGLPFEVWDISETISQLAYLTHNHFRYYGKFPSTLAAGFLNRFATAGDRVIDNYCGSGTTLVEAVLRGMPCTGLDINPFAVLASKVKTHIYDPDELRREADIVLAKLHRWCPPDSSVSDGILFNAVEADAPEVDIPNDASMDKWFTPKVQRELALVRNAVLEINDEWTRNFFLCAFFAIIRRVSVAYDGEVRPHVNKSKKQRDTLSAFTKKLADMIERAAAMADLTQSTSSSCVSVVQADNRDLGDVLRDEPPFGVALSHPPYLNCFDYLPVYRLEFLWADIMPEITPAGDYKALRKQEVRAWPATTAEARDQYFNDQRIIYTQLRTVLREGARLGIVIGDSTLKKELIRVHEILAAMLTETGYQLERIIYRTTHYGTGKYSYEHRADYHSSDEVSHWASLDKDPGKRDAIIVARAC